MKRLTAILVSILLADPAMAAYQDVADRAYALGGQIVAKGRLLCSNMTIAGSPITSQNSFEMQFGPVGDAGGTFQISNDNIAPGKVIEGDIFSRKGNRLILKYATAATPEEAAGEMLELVQKKADQMGSEFGTIPFEIKKYSFVGKARRTELLVTEKLFLTGPYKNCKAKYTITRKVRGPQLTK